MCIFEAWGKVRRDSDSGATAAHIQILVSTYSAIGPVNVAWLLHAEMGCVVNLRQAPRYFGD